MQLFLFIFLLFLKLYILVSLSLLKLSLCTVSEALFLSWDEETSMQHSVKVAKQTDLQRPFPERYLISKK